MCRCGHQLFHTYAIPNFKSKTEMKIKVSDMVIGTGGYGNVKHAFWLDKSKCVALKVVDYENLSTDSSKEAADNEISVLQYISKASKKKRHYIIELYGSQKNEHILYIAMELGGISLFDYFEIKDRELLDNGEIQFNATGEFILSEEREELLTTIFKCAAKGLEQFHKFGIHLDVKGINFVIPRQHNMSEPLTMCKLIDFNSSIITKKKYKILKNFIGTRVLMAPEIFNESEIHRGFKVTREVDIWSFGIMMRTMMGFRFQRQNNNSNQQVLTEEEQIANLLNDLDNYRSNNNYSTKLDRVLKGCVQINQKDRPSMSAIFNFLENKCDYFSYEAKHERVNGKKCK
uniref:Protein kinase domain-containing protein n=2 Tax=Meloidogyne TaxID=189290 RepID=A0A914NLZ5_MELIC